MQTGFAWEECSTQRKKILCPAGAAGKPDLAHALCKGFAGPGRARGRAPKGFRGRGPVALRDCSPAPGRRTSRPGLNTPRVWRTPFPAIRPAGILLFISQILRVHRAIFCQNSGFFLQCTVDCVRQDVIEYVCMGSRKLRVYFFAARRGAALPKVYGNGGSFNPCSRS